MNTLSRSRRVGAQALSLCAATLALTTAAAGAVPSDAVIQQRVAKVLAATPLMDGHNDLPEVLSQYFKSKGHPMDLSVDGSNMKTDGPPLMTDIPRLKAGHVGG